MVTGASDGIGKALAVHIAGLGAQVVLHGRNTKKLESVYDQITNLQDSLRPSIAVLDLATADGDAYSSLVNSIEQEFGRLDGLVHNAGILGQRLSIEQYDVAEWQRVMHVNLTVPFVLTQALLPLLRQSSDPSIIFTSSGVGRVGKAFWGAYSVSKFGTEALSQILADENRHTSLRQGLVHNAGILGQRLSIEQYDVAEWQRVMHVNLTVPFVLTQALLPLLRQSSDPSIIFTSSGVGRVGKAFWGAYSVSKFGTEALSQILADENRHTSLRANCINPGPIRTKMRLAAYPAEDRDALKRPEDVMASYVYLLGPDSQGVTGESIDVQ